MKRRLLTTVWLMLLTSVFAVTAMAQTVTVQVNSAGGLWDALEAQGITDFSTVKSLKVTGILDNTDFQLIKNLMTGLEDVDLEGTNMTQVPEKLFYEKLSLKTVRLPEKVTHINGQAFCRCWSLVSVNFGNQVTTTGKIVFPASFRKVEWEAFNECRLLTHLDFTACTAFEGFGGGSFSNCFGLQQVLLPSEGNFNFDGNCFCFDTWQADEYGYGQCFQEITLTKAVNSLGDNSFPNRLKTMYVESVAPPDCYDYAFDNIEKENLTVYVPKGSKKLYAVANGWTKIYTRMQELGFKVNISGYGSLQKGSSTYTDGDVCFPNSGNATILKVVPEIGCELISMKLDGNELTGAADGTFTIPEGTTVGTLDVAFTANPITIENTNGGELNNKIQALGLKPSTIRALKVIGKMNSSDWNLVSNVMRELEEIDLSETNVQEVPYEGFRDHTNLRICRLPEEISYLRNNAFYNCKSLNIISFGDLGNNKFPPSLKHIEGSCFSGGCEKLESVDFSACINLQGFDSYAFDYCTDLKTLILPKTGDYSIGWEVFQYADVTTLTLTKAVNSIRCRALPSKLKDLYVESNTPLNVEGTCSFENLDLANCTLYVPIGATEAFSEANGWSSFTNVQEYGFKVNIRGYGSLQQGNLIIVNGEALFTQGNTTTLKAVPEMGNDIISISLNDSPLPIGNDGTFTIPAEATIGTLNVSFTTNPITINNPNGGELKAKITEIGIEPSVIHALKVTGKMSNKDWNFVASSLQMIELFDISETNVTSIPESAFRDHQYLTTVHLPSTVTTIGSWAFQSCHQLTTIDGCDNVEEIGECAFEYCDKLANFPIGNKLRSLSSGVFGSCSSLPETLVMPASLTSLGWCSVFNGSSIRTFDLSQCTLNSSLANNTFGKCTSLMLPEKGDYQLAYSAMIEAQFKELRLPAALSYIYGEDVLPATLECLYVTRSTPIEVGDNNSFRKIDFDNCILYVPVGTKEAYSEARGWSNFTNIKECGFMVKTDGFGVVKYEANNYKNGELFFPPMGEALTMQIVPSPGYELATLKVNGIAFDYADDGTFTVPATLTGGNIEATFVKKQLEVAVTVEGNGSYTISGQTYTTTTTLAANGGDVVKMQLQPATGYFVKQVTFNGDDVALKNGGLEVSTKEMDENTVIAIIFSNDASSVATVTFQQEGFGAVNYGGETFEDGATLTVDKGKSITLSIVGAGDSDLQSLTVNGTDVTTGIIGNAYTLSNITTNATVKTSFFSPNMITVENPNGGELKDLIAAMGSNSRTIRTLKVVGKVTNKDWAFVTSNLSRIEVFDISETNVTSIPESTFRDHQYLTTVHLPSTVTTINNWTFYNCLQLTVVDGCDNVEEIGERAFEYCSKLANFPFGNKLRSLSSGVFGSCSSLPETLVMPASLSTLGWDNVFNGSSIRTFDLSQCTLSCDLAYNTFGECTSLLLPEKGDYHLAYSAMSEAKFKELRLPAALSYIYGEDVLPATLERFYVTRSTPIDVGDNNSFRKIDFDNCTLYVPVGSVEAYSEAPRWAEFIKVVEYGLKVSVGEQGKLRADGQTLMGTTTFFPNGAVTFTIIPNAGWHADAVTLNDVAIPFADNKFTLSADQLMGNLIVTFAINRFNLDLQIAGNGKVKLGSLEYVTNQILPVDSLSKLNFTLEPAEGLVVSSITFNGKESVVQNGGTNYVTPAITANSTLAITFGTSGPTGDMATYTVTTSENGTVEYLNTSLLPQTTIQVKKGVDAVFTIKPDDYYVIEKVLLDGTNVTDQVDANGQLTVKNVNADATLQVTFIMNPHVIIALEEGMRLDNALTDAQKQSVMKLTVTGQLWEEDYYTMRDKMPMLAEVDLSKVDVTNMDYVPYKAFCITESWDNSVGKASLVSIQLPEGIRHISDWAFAGCSNLKEVNLNELKNLESISTRAFGWTALNVVDLSQTKITSLGSEFYKVKGLENVKLPKTINYLGDVFTESGIMEVDLSSCTELKTLDGTFRNSKKLEKVILPEGLTAINGAFSECYSLTTVNFPKSLQSIGNDAFSSSKLKFVDLSSCSQLVSISWGAFRDCHVLGAVLLPSSLQSLGENALYNTSITAIDLSNTQILDIKESTFNECHQLETVKLPANLKTIGNSAFANCEKLAGMIELPATIVSVGEAAFWGTQVPVVKCNTTTPPVITSSSFGDKWEAAFVPEGYANVYKSTEIWEDKVILDKEVHAEVTVSNEGNLAIDINQQVGIAPATITHLKVHGPLGSQDFAIMRSNMTLLYDLDMEDAEVSVIPERAFLDKKVLMNVKLPASLLRIEQNAFGGCSSLKGSLSLPNGLRFIGWAAFQGCNSLEEVVLNQNLEVIQGYAFEGCSSLQQEITLPRDFQSLGERAFANCTSLYGTVKFNRDFYMFMGTEGYGSSAGACFENCSKIETVDMSEPDFLDEIPYRTFAGCTSLTTVLLPPTLDRIDNEAFSDCTSLDGIEFPNTLLVINWGAFQNCTSLRSINLSDCKSLGTIEGNAFYNCSSLETAYLPKSLNWINSYAFADCRKLANLTVEALQPADLGEYVFRHVHTDRCVLSIPTGTFEDYLSAAQWGEFVSMRKNIDVKVGEGANLYFMNNESVAAARGARRAPGAGPQGAKVKDGSSLYVQENETAVFMVNPDENVQIQKVLFNGKDVTSQMVNGTYETPGVTDASSFEVQVKVVGDIHVKELRMLDDDVAVKMGENRQLRFAVYPTNATNKNIQWSSDNTNVATVNSDGIITGVNPGRAEITAKTIDGGFEQKCQIVIMSNNYWIVMDNTVENFVENGVTLPLALHNEGEARDIQFDVYMPEGVSMNDWYGNFGIELTGRSNGHSISAARTSDGAVRVIVYSLDGNKFQDSDGELLRLPFSTGEEAGNFDVAIKNIHISGPKNFDFAAPNHTIHFNLKDYPMGDSNGNGEITINDAVNTVDNILEKNVDRFIKKAADVNKDDQITVADVTGTVDILLERPSHSRAAKTNDAKGRLYMNDLTMAIGEQQAIGLQIENAADFIGFQCDVQLPAGMQVVRDEDDRLMVDLSGVASNHVISANLLDNGVVRIVVISPQNECLNVLQNNIVNLTVKTDDTMADGSMIDIRDIRLVRNYGNSEYLAPDASATVSIGAPTAIERLLSSQGLKMRTEGHYLVVEASAAMVLQMVSADGILRNLQIRAGENRIFIENAGVYIIGGMKFFIK